MRLSSTALLLPLLLACDGEPSGPPTLLNTLPRELNAGELQVQTASNEFSFRLLKRLSTELTGENLFVSPLSISMALGMAMNGAAGGTFDEMRASLGFASLPQTTINESYKGLIELLRSLDQRTTMTIANSVWHSTDFSPANSFRASVEGYFGASVYGRNFAASQTLTDINSWVSGSTGGRIPSILDSIDPDEVMFLINAIHFDAVWRTPFDPDLTSALPFQQAGGGTTQKQFMSRLSDSVEFTVTPELTAVRLPYGNGAFSMLLLLPPEGQQLGDIIGTLTAHNIALLQTQLRFGRAQLLLPRFELDFKRELTSDLRTTGMNLAFDPNNADFSGFSDDPLQLYLSRVQHRAAVEVDERGTVASAATAVGVGIVSAPPTLVFDRPFLFLIQDISGTVLFAGVLAK